MIKVILFDLDGVLIDACDWHYEALNRALLEIANIEIVRDEHISTFNGLPTKTKLNILVEQGRVNEDQVERICQQKLQHTLEIVEDRTERDDKKIAMLSMLRLDGIKTACVTNCIRRTAEEMLIRLGLWGKLDLLVTNEDVVFPKPHPAGFWQAMSVFGVIGEETLIVEDSPKGREAGKASGADVLAVKDAKDLTWLKIADRLLEHER